MSDDINTAAAVDLSHLAADQKLWTPTSYSWKSVDAIDCYVDDASGEIVCAVIRDNNINDESTAKSINGTWLLVEGTYLNPKGRFINREQAKLRGEAMIAMAQAVVKGNQMNQRRA